MKKSAMLTAVLAVAAGLFGWSAMAWAASDAKSLNVNVAVKSRFVLALNGAHASGFDFGELDPGTGVSGESVGLRVSTNHGMPWNIKLSASPLTHTVDGVTQMPSGALKFSIDGSGVGTYTLGRGVLIPIPSTSGDIYSSASSEEKTSALAFDLGVSVDVPADQKVGNYSTTLSLQMLDAY